MKFKDLIEAKINMSFIFMFGLSVMFLTTWLLTGVSPLLWEKVVIGMGIFCFFAEFKTKYNEVSYKNSITNKK